MYLKNYINKILVENLSKHTNSFYKVNQENNNSRYTDVSSQNDQPFVSSKKSIKINNKNTNRSIDVTRNNFVSQSRFNVLNCDVINNVKGSLHTRIFTKVHREAFYKKQRNKCVSLRRKSIKKYFDGITKYGIATNENFWNLMKPFLTNKGHLNHQDIMIFDCKNIITKKQS